MRRFRRASVLAACITAGLTLANIAPVTAASVPAVRGFDGKTINVAGLGSAQNFADAEVGAEARFKRFNDDNEIKGVKIEFSGFTDDKLDPANALSEARRIVTQEQAFAIVPAVSPVLPADYLAQQHVPAFGWGITANSAYCSPKPSTKIWGFGYNGCFSPADPSFVADTFANLYKYLSTKTGAKAPSIALFSQDDNSGKNGVRLFKRSAEGAGLDVVYAKGTVPFPPVADYTPYVQEWLSADDGKPADALFCLLATQCLAVWDAVQGSGYDGVFLTPLYSDLLVKPLAGTVALPAYNVAPNPGLKQMQKDLDAVKPSATVSIGSTGGYFGADMFISALKKVAAQGEDNITPEKVQEAASTMTWQIKGFVGPTTYPDATVSGVEACNTVVQSDGTAWNVLEPYRCSANTYKTKA